MSACFSERPIFIFYSAAGCGRDISDRSIMWIIPQPVTIEDEADAIMASIIYFTVSHADLRSLREGITLVLGKNYIFNLANILNLLGKLLSS